MKSTLRDHIVEGLRSAILSGEIAAGSQLVETSLARDFNVSRGPLREAMRQLIDEGLLVTVPYTGTHVITLSIKDVREIHSMLSANARLWHGIQAHWEMEPDRLADTLLCLEFGVLDELRYIRFAQAAAN